MKKIISLLLITILFASLCACKTNENTGTSADISENISKGIIPECKYKLGQDAEKLAKVLEQEDKEAYERDEDYVFSLTEEEDYVVINNGNYIYYYEKSKKDNGVSYIVSLNKAYGFEIGTSILDIEAALSGTKYIKEESTEKDVFFLLGYSGGTVIEATVDGNTLLFVFENNMLTATALFDTNNWTV